MDNGIVIRFKEGKEPRWAKRLDVLDDRPKDGFGRELELAYWRKCWNVREVVLGGLAESGWPGEYRLSASELHAICKALGKALNRKAWDEAYCDNDAIWEWDEVGSSMRRQNRRCLKAAKRLKRMDPGDYCLTFYDSY